MLDRSSGCEALAAPVSVEVEPERSQGGSEVSAERRERDAEWWGGAYVLLRCAVALLTWQVGSQRIKFAAVAL